MAKKKLRLVVKKSQLPKAGKGLYTKDFIKKGTRVIEYKGEIIDDKESERRAEEEDIYGYMFFINKKHCIDAYYTPQHMARYANDARGIARVKGLKNNADYEIVGKKCFITTTRDVEPGEEIFVDYGKEYWDVIRYNIKLDEKRAKEAAKKKLKKQQKATKKKKRKSAKK
ncbi:MAG TPA: SET domain-containing protein [Cyclobacteriaceae bacterium]|nr:SET domain-containing protein [Cyclobacteriaceae bacterium]